jgi:hypothetical protein
VLELRPEEPRVGIDGSVEILDRNAQMVDPPRLQEADAIEASGG